MICLLCLVPLKDTLARFKAVLYPIMVRVGNDCDDVLDLLNEVWDLSPHLMSWYVVQAPKATCRLLMTSVEVLRVLQDSTKALKRLAQTGSSI